MSHAFDTPDDTTTPRPGPAALGSPAMGLLAPRRRWAPLVGGAALVLLITGGAAAWLLWPAAHQARYITGEVTRGDLRSTIEATGTAEPLLQVQVGAQVSGRIAQVLVDFNDTVAPGQLLAEIEPAPFQAKLNQTKAALASAEAQLQKARVDLVMQEKNLTRVAALVQAELTARADLDSAQAGRDSAQAQVQVARAQVEQARANVAEATESLSYTKIVAPIAGTVINRAIDPGQTVASSLQAPVLFIIANDLTRMQVVAAIDEADVSAVKDGAAAEMRVDAFPNETFHGVVRELRVQPTTTSGVVTYPAIVDVDNVDKKLRPGMTVTLTLATATREDVLRVPNAALRFRPVFASGSSDTPARAGRPGGPRGGRSVQILHDGQPRAVRVRVGISDGMLTEVSGEGLSEGAAVILEDAAAPVSSARPPSGGRRGPRVF